MCPKESKILGLRVAEIGKSERRLLNLIALCEHLRSVVLQAGSSYRILFSFFMILSRRGQGDVIPGLSKASLEEMRQFLLENYYHDVITMIMESINGLDGKNDQELLACFFDAHCDMGRNSNEVMYDCNPAGSEIPSQEEVEENEMIDRTLRKIETWLGGATASDDIQTLIEESSAESLQHGIYGIDCVKAWILCASERPCETISNDLASKVGHVTLSNTAEGMYGSSDLSYSEEGSLLAVVASSIERGSHIQYFDVTRNDSSKGSRNILVASIEAQQAMVQATAIYKGNSIIMAYQADDAAKITQIPYENWKFDTLGSSQNVESRSNLIEMVNSTCGEVKTRTQHGRLVQPCAISPSRGVAMLLLEHCHVILLDLEEDEEPEDDDDLTYNND